MKYLYTTNDPINGDIEHWKCECGRTHVIRAGGDIAACDCEFENEGQQDA